MSIVETKELLGKRVTFNIDYGVADYAPKSVTGLIGVSTENGENRAVRNFVEF